MANVLNVYDSLYGNTREVAQIIHRALEKDHAVITADISRISDQLIQKTDAFIIGSPIHYWKPTRTVSAFIMKIFRFRLESRIGIVYDTRLDRFVAGNAASKMQKMLCSLRFSVMGKAEHFYVETVKGPLKLGEVAKSERFAERIAGFLSKADIKDYHTPGFILDL